MTENMGMTENMEVTDNMGMTDNMEMTEHMEVTENMGIDADAGDTEENEAMILKIISEMPKIDLHCHLDGSLPLDTVRALTGKNGIKQEDLQAARDCGSLKTYLEKFELPLEGMQTYAGLKRAAADCLMSLQDDHIIYAEIRFAPMLSAGPELSCAKVIEAVLAGMAEGENRTGIHWQVICCAMRGHTPQMNLRMLDAAAGFMGRGVCAVDLAGDEASYPAEQYRYFFEKAESMGIPFTIHAGECHSVENIRESIRMGAARIGHGLTMLSDEGLMEEAAGKQTGIEMCPTSNYQTRAVREGEEYPLKKYMHKGILVTVNTDNRTVSQTTMTRELLLAGQLMQLHGKDRLEIAKQLTENAVKISFLDRSKKEMLSQQLQEFWKGIERTVKWNEVDK